MMKLKPGQQEIQLPSEKRIRRMKLRKEGTIKADGLHSIHAVPSAVPVSASARSIVLSLLGIPAR